MSLFTKAERQIINTILAGHTANKEIARITAKDEKTVEKQLNALYHKTEVQDKTQFVLFLVRFNLAWVQNGQLTLQGIED